MLMYPEYDTDYNIFIWTGWNDEAGKVLMEVLKKGIAGIPTKVATIVMLGGRVYDNIAKREMKYKKPHWVPMYLKYTGVKR